MLEKFNTEMTVSEFSKGPGPQKPLSAMPEEDRRILDSLFDGDLTVAARNFPLDYEDYMDDDWFIP